MFDFIKRIQHNSHVSIPLVCFTFLYQLSFYNLKTQSCLKQCNAANCLQEKSQYQNTQYLLYATFSMAYIRPRHDHAQHTQIDENIYWLNSVPKYAFISNDLLSKHIHNNYRYGLAFIGTSTSIKFLK